MSCKVCRRKQAYLFLVNIQKLVKMNFKHSTKNLTWIILSRNTDPKGRPPEYKTGMLANGEKHFLSLRHSSTIFYFYSKTNEMHQLLKIILFCSSALHVSDGLSVHHQESKTVRTASPTRSSLTINLCFGPSYHFTNFGYEVFRHLYISFLGITIWKI